MKQEQIDLEKELLSLTEMSVGGLPTLQATSVRHEWIEPVGENDYRRHAVELKKVCFPWMNGVPCYAALVIIRGVKTLVYMSPFVRPFDQEQSLS